jgi:hypothetical protein
MSPLITIVWICIAIFAVTGLITLLALLNIVKLGRTPENHDRYLSKLVSALIIEIVVGTVTGYFKYLSTPEKTLNGRWELIRIGDCGGSDFDDSPGAEPDVRKCNSPNITAVCWDYVQFKNSGKAWCTYKRTASSNCFGGLNPGRLFKCSQ